MRILIVNSNTTESVTRTVELEARRVASAGTEILAVTAPFGVPAIETPADAEIAADATLEALQRYGFGADAAIIACFSDPGLAAARATMPFPVLGIAQAAMLTAFLAGSRFAVVTVAPRSVPGIQALIDAYGLAAHSAGVRAASMGVLEAHREPERLRAELAREIDDAVRKDGADVIILGGAVTAGLVRDLAPVCPVPLLEGVSCAVRQAETLADLLKPEPRSE